MRPSGRENNQLREINIIRNFTKHAEGSILVEFGDTRVICTASVTEGVPRFLKGKNQGWLTAEYSMLPRATHTRTERDIARGSLNGRTAEIQRLIGRALRSAVDMTKIGENTITIDCDVIQADGGTRTAAITGGFVALMDALSTMRRKDILTRDPIKHFIASVSVGIYCGQPILDLEYLEDVAAETDMNVVMNDQGHFIEIQGTAETKTFSPAELNTMLELAQQGVSQLIALQKKILGQ